MSISLLSATQHFMSVKAPVGLVLPCVQFMTSSDPLHTYLQKSPFALATSSRVPRKNCRYKSRILYSFPPRYLYRVSGHAQRAFLPANICSHTQNNYKLAQPINHVSVVLITNDQGNIPLHCGKHKLLQYRQSPRRRLCKVKIHFTSPYKRTAIPLQPWKSPEVINRLRLGDQ